MARVTVEDCVVKIPNRFKLVMIAAQRARSISAGASEKVDADDDKPPVIALREIAEGRLSIPELGEELIKGLQTYVKMDEVEEEDDLDILAVQQDSTEPADEAAPVLVLDDVTADATAAAAGDIIADKKVPA